MPEEDYDEDSTDWIQDDTIHQDFNTIHEREAAPVHPLTRKPGL
jgi:hypothetical protein